MASRLEIRMENQVSQYRDKGGLQDRACGRSYEDYSGLRTSQRTGIYRSGSKTWKIWAIINFIYNLSKKVQVFCDLHFLL